MVPNLKARIVWIESKKKSSVFSKIILKKSRKNKKPQISAVLIFYFFIAFLFLTTFYDSVFSKKSIRAERFYPIRHEFFILKAIHKAHFYHWEEFIFIQFILGVC